MPEKRLSSNCEKVSKINLRIISKAHAYLQSIDHQDICKVSKESELKTEGGVAHTRHPLSIHFHCQNTEKRLSSICKKSVKN